MKTLFIKCFLIVSNQPERYILSEHQFNPFNFRHVIGYLLEHGAIDTSTLFSSDRNVKPPQFNKTEEKINSEEEVSPRHRNVPYSYSPSYVPK